MAGSFDDIIRNVLQMKEPTPDPVGAGSLFNEGQSENAPGLIAPGNINIHQRPTVPYHGGIATVRSMSFEDDDGKNVLIPTVIEGRGVVQPDAAIQYYRQTGKHLGVFDTPENADAYAQSLHEQQADEYK